MSKKKKGPVKVDILKAMRKKARDEIGLVPEKMMDPKKGYKRRGKYKQRWEDHNEDDD